MKKRLEWVYRRHSALQPDISVAVFMSVGSRQTECRSVNIATEYLSQKIILVFPAAGYSATDACMFHPASAKGSITVGAFELYGGSDSAWNKTN